MALIDSEKLIHDLIQILHDDVCAPNGHLDPYYVFKTIREQPQLATNLQPTCNQLATDCISRQAAIDALDGSITVTGRNSAERVMMYLRAVKERIEELPSAQQKPLKYTGDSICLYCQTTNCDGCMYEPVMEVKR